eukprot:3062766-Alexandrium_andersonii.AAC.1
MWLRRTGQCRVSCVPRWVAAFPGRPAFRPPCSPVSEPRGSFVPPRGAQWPPLGRLPSPLGWRAGLRGRRSWPSASARGGP